MSSISDLSTLIRNGASVVYAHDRDVAKLVTDLANQLRNPVYLFVQGHVMVRYDRATEPGETGTLSEVTTMVGRRRRPIDNPLVAIKAACGLDPNAQITPEAPILLAIDNTYLEREYTSLELLRAHHVALTELLQDGLPTDDRESVLERNEETTAAVGDADHYVPRTHEPATTRHNCIVLVAQHPEPPEGLQRYAINVGTITHPSVPDEAIAHLRKLLGDGANGAIRGLCYNEAFLINNLAGDSDIKDREKMVTRTKKFLMTNNGVISELMRKITMDDIGGYDGVRNYITRRRELLKRREMIEKLNIMVKGIALVGLPGTGKTILAEAMAREWALPAYSLDIDAAFGRYVGQSESRLRAGLESAERMSPCVLLINEIDKALSGIGDGQAAGSDVPLRLFKMILEAMERKNGIIFIATANKVSHLPPELLRRGRFDQIFWLGLPKTKERTEIAKIHLRKRCQIKKSMTEVMAEDEAKDLIKQWDGFTGSEIEAIINESVTTAILDDREKVTYKDLLQETDTCVTIERNKEEIKELEAWAETHAVNASSEK